MRLSRFAFGPRRSGVLLLVWLAHCHASSYSAIFAFACTYLPSFLCSRKRRGRKGGTKPVGWLVGWLLCTSLFGELCTVEEQQQHIWDVCIYGKGGYRGERRNFDPGYLIGANERIGRRGQHPNAILSVSQLFGICYDDDGRKLLVADDDNQPANYLLLLILFDGRRPIIVCREYGRKATGKENGRRRKRDGMKRCLRDV